MMRQRRSAGEPADHTLVLLVQGMPASWRLSSRVDTRADGNAVRPLAEASLPLPPERRYSSGNAGV